MSFDPIADMIIKIKNAGAVNFKNVIFPYSNLKYESMKLLKEEGFIEDYCLANKIEKKTKIKKSQDDDLNIEESKHTAEVVEEIITDPALMQGIKYIKVFLKYDRRNKHAIKGVSKISKSGRRIYSKYNEIPRLRNGYGVTILTTSKGILTNKKAINEKVGGELLFSIW